MDKQHPKPCVGCRYFSRRVSGFDEVDECSHPKTFKTDVLYGFIDVWHDNTAHQTPEDVAKKMDVSRGPCPRMFVAMIQKAIDDG